MSAGRVVQIADFGSPFATNFISSLWGLERASREDLGLASAFVFPERSRERPWLRELTKAGMTVRFVDPAAPHRSRVRALAKVGEELGVVLYHSHFGTFDVDAAFAAHRVDCAAIWHVHSPYPKFDELRKRAGERIKFEVVSRLLVDRIVAVSPSVAESVMAHGAPRRKCAVVLNGIDTERLRPLDAGSRSAVREHAGIGEDEVVFLLFGWDPQRKGVDILVEAAQLVPHLSKRRFRCLVVSDDAGADLRDFVGGSPLARVIPPTEDVRELYGLADCFVSASRSEGLPYAIGEAMAYGLPVISSDLPAVASVYGGGNSGLLTFRSGDGRELAAAMVRILELSREARRDLAGRNKTYIRENLSLEKWTEEIVGVYRSVLEPPDRPHKP